MTTGEVRGMEVKTEFDDEDEHKAILLVLKTKPLFLDGRVVFTKLLKKGSNLVREVHDKQSMNNPHQWFWEIVCSSLEIILG